MQAHGDGVHYGPRAGIQHTHRCIATIGDEGVAAARIHGQGAGPYSHRHGTQDGARAGIEQSDGAVTGRVAIVR